VVREIRGLELSRDALGIDPMLHASRDVAVRRAAARALARISHEPSRSRLLRTLADEDPEVVAWSAYGLGATCAGSETATVRALVARAASLAADGSPAAPAERFALRAEDALADALSRCGSGPAEQTLKGWLTGPMPRAESAALALGRLAGRRQRLDDTTVVALLDAASREPAVPFALAAIGRLESLSETVQARVLEVATRALPKAGPDRALAIRSLAAAGPRATSTLTALVVDARRSVTERAVAAATLGRLGAEGSRALGSALDSLVPPAADLSAPGWPGAAFPALAAALAALTPDALPSEALVRLAEAPLPDGLPPPDRRRRILLRCGAASILAGKASQSERLVHCDPDPGGRTVGLATVRVLDRGEITGARFERFLALARADDPAVRRAALAVVPSHPEIPPIADLLATALGAKEPGVVIQAARILALDPRRAAMGGAEAAAPEPTSEGRRPPSPAVVDALAQALDRERPPDEVETRAALARAAGALATLSLKPRVERLCRHPNVSVRRGAETALRAFGVATATCPGPSPTPAGSAAPSASPAGPARSPPFALATAPATLTFVTDAGRLGVTLTPALAPAAAARIVDLARSGFYDGLPIHRVVPGAAVQLGDSTRDGFGGSGRAPLPCETSPVSFDALSVGMALSGRDTGSSQIFVTLVPEPQLYGDYALIGTADPDWAGVAEGDVIRRVEVRE
jgi:cyclophilin family peptidyl-prolyl cis-trans isomerase